jgi:hypothetical protein
MGNSAAFPVIVSNGNAPIGFRWEKVLLPNFRKILALARFSRWENRKWIQFETFSRISQAFFGQRPVNGPVARRLPQ